MNLTDGILRARFRSSFEQPELLEPGEVYEYLIDLGHTANVFPKGHCIRLEVSSSSFPRFYRNTNTGSLPEKDTGFLVAHQNIYHAQAHPSYVELPVRTK
jgi:putative CocE/NonD family hydrolase